MMRALAIGLAALALAACGPRNAAASPPEIPWLPLAADLTPPPTPTPQPMPVPPGTPACTADELSATVVGSQGATGHVVTSFALAGFGRAACFLDGTPSVTLLDAGGHDLAFKQRSPYFPAVVIGPVLVTPAVAPPDVHTPLKYGEAAFGIDWVSQPEACLGENAAPVAAVRIGIPAGGTLSVPILSVPAGYRCQGVGVSSFEGPAAPVEPSPTPVLPSIAVTAPATAKVGQALEYTVTLTNDTEEPMNLTTSCPNYEEELFPAASGPPLGGKHFYKLNCAPAGTIGPGKSATFKMVLEVPTMAAPGDYTLVFMVGYWNAMSRFTPAHPVHVQ